MKRITSSKLWSATNAYRVLLALAALALGLGLVARFYRLSWPNSQVFDEVYFPVFAWKYLHHLDFFDVHPPLGKLLIAFGEAVYGNVTLGWRIVPALFGVANIWLFARIWQVYRKEPVGVAILTAFTALETVFILYSRTGLMDGIQLFFIFAALLAALSVNDSSDVVWVATMIGLAVSIKWLAAAILVPVFYILLRKGHAKVFLVSLSWSFCIYILIVYIGQILIGATHPWDSVLLWHQQSWDYQVGLKATHPWGSRWWSWPLELRPVLFWYVADTPGGTQMMTTLGNPVVWWASTLAVLGSVYELARVWFLERKSILDHPLLPLMLGWAAFFLPWAPIHRVLFHYHYLPAFGFALLMLVYFLTEWWKKWPWLVVLFVVLCLLCAIYFLPFAIGWWPLSAKWLARHIWIHSWLY